MKKVRIGKSLKTDMTLWRYMSLDKFIDLISTKTLFLSPLSFYEKTDPFEGLLPKVALKATIDIYLKPIIVMEEQCKQFKRQLLNDDINEDHERFKPLDDFENKLKLQKEELVPLKNKISKSTRVNCWYYSEKESEAMWKLYSDGGKGIAIKTTVGSLVESINTDIQISLGRVKYLDFLSTTLELKDCLTDGVLSPLLKRNEYEHENEVRLYSTPDFYSSEKWLSHKPTPISIDVDIKKLIESIYISPYVSEPFGSSVYKLGELFDIPSEKIVYSQLLKNYESLFNI